MRRMYSKPQLLEAVESESKLNGIKVFEDIKDKDGHNRFIEGNVNTAAGQSSLTKLYGKWSLSGTHLIIVYCCTIPKETTISYATIATLTLPKWIYDKIVPIVSNVVELKQIPMYKEGQTTYSQQARLVKDSDNKINIFLDTFSNAYDRDARFAFDLLIDND